MRTNGKYILKGKEVIETHDLLEWSRSLENADRQIRRDVIGKSLISTVFLGLDHAYGGGKPLLFETMIFGGKFDDQQERYSTYEEAEEGHKKWVIKVQEELNARHD